MHVPGSAAHGLTGAALLLQILVLGWCVSQRDMEVVRKVVQQVCVAHAPEGGTTVSAWNTLSASKTTCNMAAPWAPAAVCLLFARAVKTLCLEGLWHTGMLPRLCLMFGVAGCGHDAAQQA